MTQPLESALGRAVTDYLAALDGVGIEVAEPYGRVTIDPETGSTRVGFVALWDNGSIVAVPCVGTTPMQIASVCHHAEVALLDGATGPQWRRLRNRGWETSIHELPEARA